MQYEVVTLTQKQIVGIAVRTGNADPKMQQILEQVWTDFYSPQGYPAIENKLNAHTIGLYNEYKEDTYLFTAGVEVSAEARVPEGCVAKRIPAGKYAKFYTEGQLPAVVGQAWEEIWRMDLKRSYTGDFEEYLEEADGYARINLYIALTE